MKKLSKEKRNQVILSSVMVLAVIGGLWSFLIRFQQSGLRDLAAKKTASETKLSRVLEIIQNSKQIEIDFGVVSNKLATLEAPMASGDLYSSMVTSMRKFKQNYSIDIPQLNSGGPEVPLNVLPRFPYKQVTLTIAGTGYYHELGRFISDFENEFPSSRIMNLELSPASVQNPDEKEKLAFRMEVVSLVKPTSVATVIKPL
jgi:hypothetical protein